MCNLKKLLTYNSSRHRLWEETARFAQLVPEGALVLDAGSGDAPYKTLFNHTRYESADFHLVNRNYAQSTYVCDLQNIPVENCRFDYIIFNQVMEHLPEPKSVLKELNRVLKSGGKMLYSGPLFFEEHEQPYDFFRYTRFGLHYLFSASNFKIDYLDWLEGYFGTVGYQLFSMARYLPIKPKDLGNGFIGYGLSPIMVLIKFFFAGFSFLFHRLEIRAKFKNRGYPKNYFAIVSKIS